ncbi:hypothetical protein [Bradyrhizobium sp. 2S1]|uniref:hypothetical protein n=1 Tax=Bradyrhizobium sp. 2S1 TaxID=1404429 RepID=UPI00140D25A3|nr:hypothetical protein [Bradyrhizobium sp. 2S1]MCK7672210.1 hypothetical protein [Bradyrhizobium sp. 2S1]
MKNNDGTYDAGRYGNDRAGTPIRKTPKARIATANNMAILMKIEANGIASWVNHPQLWDVYSQRSSPKPADRSSEYNEWNCSSAYGQLVTSSRTTTS